WYVDRGYPGHAISAPAYLHRLSASLRARESHPSPDGWSVHRGAVSLNGSSGYVPDSGAYASHRKNLKHPVVIDVQRSPDRPSAARLWQEPNNLKFHQNGHINGPVLHHPADLAAPVSAEYPSILHRPTRRNQWLSYSAL